MNETTTQAPPAGTGNPLRLWIMDDHQSFRALLAEYLGTIPELRVVGTGEEEDALYAAVNRGEVDIVLLDLQLSGVGGFAVVERLQQLPVPVRVLILSAQATVHALTLAQMLGVAGYLQKTAPLDDLVLALQQLARGETYFPALNQADSPGGSDANAPIEIVRHEVEVMRGLTRGDSVQSLSQQLRCPPSVIYRTRMQLMVKIQAHNPQEFAAYVARIGLAQRSGERATEEFLPS